MMKSLKHLVLWLTLATSSLYAGELELADQLLLSHRDNQLIPLVSSSHPDLSVEQAYLVQAHYVKKRLAHDKVAGFKAGLTSLAAQNKFNVNQALSGILFASGDLSATESIQLSHFKRLMLETEIGFEIGTAITSLITTQAELKQHIKAVFPVIELPDIGFTSKPKGIDIIAANVGAAAFIKGKPITDFTDFDLNALTVTLTKNGQVVNTGKGLNALGNQWQAALWLVNRLIAQGSTLEPGQFLITGAMGKMIQAQQGDYQAYFGKLGQIAFLVVP
jgi:2-keto-4-pentenoate hydratase